MTPYYPSPAGSLRILVIDDEMNIRTQLGLCLEAAGHMVVGHGNIHDALAEASWRTFDVVFLDLRLGLDNGLEFIPRLRAESPWAKVIVITAYASVDTAVEAMKRGASDYLPKPFTPAQVDVVVRRAAEQRQMEMRAETLQRALGGMDPEADLPTGSAAMGRALEMARRVAASNATVLIRGEVGTGKGRLARAIHAWSPRASGPFAAVVCYSGGPPDVADAELFGVTGRDGRDPEEKVSGWVERCDGGTLVLEDVSQAHPSIQAKLTRLLRDREYERHNEFKMRQANVRVIATTRVDLRNDVTRGRFREDLLVALEGVQVDVPPLRQRPEDIALLAERYLAYFGRENQRTIGGFTPEARDALAEHMWPGNVRELRNVIERAVLLCKGDVVGLEHLPANLLNTPSPHSVGDLVPLNTIEDLHIRKVVASTPTIARAASILGVHPGTILRRLKRKKSGDGAAGDGNGEGR